MNDNFWDIREQEREQENSLRRSIASIDAELDVVRRAASMRQSAGFSDFLKSVERLRDVATNRLISDLKLTDAGLREARSRVRSLNDVIQIVTGNGVTELLEARRAEVQNALETTINRRPKPKQEVTT